MVKRECAYVRRNIMEINSLLISQGYRLIDLEHRFLSGERLVYQGRHIKDRIYVGKTDSENCFLEAEDKDGLSHIVENFPFERERVPILIHSSKRS